MPNTDARHWLDTFDKDLAKITQLPATETVILRQAIESEDAETVYTTTERLSDLGVPIYAWITDFYATVKSPAEARRFVKSGRFDANGILYSIRRVINGASQN